MKLMPHCIVVALVACLFSTVAVAQDARPDIVVIMADDMGYSDIGCFGGEVQTPNLDRLASQGLRFTQFYNTARCCPTRAALMTGLYPHQAGMGWMTVVSLGREAYRGEINHHCLTIAEVLKPAGYETCMAGKWHLTRDDHFEQPRDSWPSQRGFEHFFGTLSGAGNYWKPATLHRDNTPITEYPENFYYTDAISDAAVGFIHNHQQNNAQNPLFMYVAYTSPHWPLHARRETIDKYRDLYRAGWDNIRAQRFARMIDMGLVDPHWEINPRDEQVAAWDSLDAKTREHMILRMAVYAAQIDAMDQGIGRIVEALRTAGRLDNTLILFLADNGGCAEGGLLGFGQMNDENIDDVGARGWASYGQSWANASNTPFREYKHWVHEGGIATPLIVHWPAGIEAKGELRTEPGHVIDVMATCIDVAHADYPQQYQGQDIHPPEGRSLRPAFSNQPIERQAIYWEHEANRAVRVGPWKLVSTDPGDWELYNLTADRTEMHDLAPSEPDRVKEMAKLWQAWAQRCDVLPLDSRTWSERIDAAKKQ